VTTVQNPLKYFWTEGLVIVIATHVIRLSDFQNVQTRQSCTFGSVDKKIVLKIFSHSFGPVLWIHIIYLQKMYLLVFIKSLIYIIILSNVAFFYPTIYSVLLKSHYITQHINYPVREYLCAFLLFKENIFISTHGIHVYHFSTQWTCRILHHTTLEICDATCLSWTFFFFYI